MTDQITTAAEARARILDAVASEGRESVLNMVVEFNNTTNNDIDGDGDVWVSDPQTGHWLDDESLIDFAAFIY